MSRPVAAPTRTSLDFTIEAPTLSRGTADRGGGLRDSERLARNWGSARVVAIGRTGGIEADGERPLWRPSSGDAPPPAAVFLGAVDGVDHWAEANPELQGPTLRELGAVLSDTDAGLVVSAVGLLGWHAGSGFCPRCGAASTPGPGGWSRTCPEGHQEFPRTDPAVIVLVHDGADRMVLARQPIWAPGRYSVLAGFTETGESLEGTVHRELAEEIGIEVTDVRYLASQPWPLPRSLMIGFAARADPDQPLRPQDDEIEEARWVTRDQVRAVLERPGWSASPQSSAQSSAQSSVPTVLSGPPGAQGIGGFDLPGSISIARRMIEGWAAAD